MKLFRKVRSLFERRSSPGSAAAAARRWTHMLLEQLFWAGAWLPKYDPEDYPRIRERMFDILVGGLAVEGAGGSRRRLRSPTSPPARGRR